MRDEFQLFLYYLKAKRFEIKIIKYLKLIFPTKKEPRSTKELLFSASHHLHDEPSHRFRHKLILHPLTCNNKFVKLKHENDFSKIK